MSDAQPAQPPNATQVPSQASQSPSPPQNQAPASKAEQVDAEPDHLIDTRLRESIKDAYTLLDFAARRAMEVTPAVRTPIIDCHQKLIQDDALTSQEEAGFWQAFADIIAVVEPVTVESIVFTSPPNVTPGKLSWLRSKLFPPKSNADKVLRGYHAIALLTLLVLLGLQVQWAIGMSIYNDALHVHKNLMSSTEDFLSAQQQLTILGDKNTTAEIDARLQADTLKRTKEREQSWEDVSYLRLWWWNRGMSATIPPYDLRLSDPSKPQIPGSAFKLDDEGERRVEFTRAELTLEVISNYYLVTLFALLGAMTQALRRLSIDIADVSLTRGSLYAIRTRIILGIISGVCMAWLTIISSAPPPAEGGTATHTIPLDAVSFLGAFAPWAMAFVSGYSVEVFFTALERLIAFITQRIRTFPSGGDAQGAAQSPPPNKTPPPSVEQTHEKPGEQPNS